MQHLILRLCILGLSFSCLAQSIPSKKAIVSNFGFTEHIIENKVRDIHYYEYRKDTEPKTKLVLYLQGSDPSPLFSYQIKNGETSFNCFLRPDFKALSNEYLYVAIDKIGFEVVMDEQNIEVPPIYTQNNSLYTRVARINEVINVLSEEHNFEKVIVYGHSEGAPVAAKLATENRNITHLGFWAGNALPDFFDFILESRIGFYKGELSDKKAQENINETINGFVNEIAKDTSNTDGSGYTKLRWWSYAEPPINNLLKVDIPIYVQVGTLDTSAPIESTYLIPLEFARMKKTNLTYKVCTGCDHGFNIQTPEGKIERKWSEIFADFITWSETH